MLGLNEQDVPGVPVLPLVLSQVAPEVAQARVRVFLANFHLDRADGARQDDVHFAPSRHGPAGPAARTRGTPQAAGTAARAAGNAAEAGKAYSSAITGRPGRSRAGLRCARPGRTWPRRCPACTGRTRPARP